MRADHPAGPAAATETTAPAEASPAAATEPYVVECLEGTPGPAIFGDGCYWPDGSNVAGADRCSVMCGEAPTSGEMQLNNGCEGGHITDPALCAEPWWNQT